MIFIDVQYHFTYCKNFSSVIEIEMNKLHPQFPVKATKFFTYFA